MTGVDLSRLRIDDRPPAGGLRRPRGPRLAVGSIAVLALAVVASFLWPLLRPVHAVRMARVQAWNGRADGVTGAAGARAGTVVEAVGWVEPDPFPIVVRPLVKGRLAQLLVLEGAEVHAGETVLATLESAELLAARDRARAAAAEREADLAMARADRELATERLRQNAEARSRLREAAAGSAAVETRLATARERARVASADAASAQALATAQERLETAGSSHPVALERARASADAAHAAAAAAEREVLGLEAEAAAWRATVALQEELARDPVDLRGALAVATARSQLAEAALDAARIGLAIAERELAWATVTAPVDGVVLRLAAMPGDTVGEGAQAIVALYDPQRLRARIDVPFDSLAGIGAGQSVEIRSDAIGEQVVHGVVQRLVHEADLLKNTLRVQIGLLDPPRLLRPETLCRARFVGVQPADPTSAETASDAVAGADVFVVPDAAVRDGAVYVFDPRSGTVRRVAVERVGQDGALVLVRGPLSPTHRIALDPVADGERVQEIAQ
ncbi:MAG: efflux RND transporter periplasmic adaptor subunit [Planctomycetes bacterium]|nr:efflux RND transporter periplasmic adaptor subunit [Planctomycetota bacterium]